MFTPPRKIAIVLANSEYSHATSQFFKGKFSVQNVPNVRKDFEMMTQLLLKTGHTVIPILDKTTTEAKRLI
jgi:hypothetical protein